MYGDMESHQRRWTASRRREAPMTTALFSALKARSISAVLLFVGVGVVYDSSGPIDPEASEAEARRPAPLNAEFRGFRWPAPDAYPLEGKPWIRGRADLIGYYKRGEEPDMVRRNIEGPEEELVEYLRDVFKRSQFSYQEGIPP